MEAPNLYPPILFESGYCNVCRTMNNHSQAYTEFEKNVSNLRRLSYGMRYLSVKKDEYIKWLRDEKGENFPEETFNQELWSTVEMELEVSNILLRTYIERYAHRKCGSLKKFFDRYSRQIGHYKIEYQRNLPKLPVLNINQDLRNYSIHSKPQYKFIQSNKTPVKILSERITLIINSSGETEIVLLHDLNSQEWQILLHQKSKQRFPTGNIHSRFMTYGEFLTTEVLECIRQIDLV